MQDYSPPAKTQCSGKSRPVLPEVHAIAFALSSFSFGMGRKCHAPDFILRCVVVRHLRRRSHAFLRPPEAIPILPLPVPLPLPVSTMSRNPDGRERINSPPLFAINSVRKCEFVEKRTIEHRGKSVVRGVSEFHVRAIQSVQDGKRISHGSQVW